MRRQGEKGISGQADSPSSRRTESTTLARTLWVTAEVVAERESWVRGQCEHLEELSRELDCVEGLAWPRKATGAQGEAKVDGPQVRVGARLGQEEGNRCLCLCISGGPGG